MNIQERLAKEIEELEAKVNPVVDAPEANTAEKVEEIDNPMPDKVEAVEPPTEEQKKKRNDWKKKAQEAERRAAGLKAKTDSVIHNSRREIEDLKRQIEELKTKPVVTVDPFDGVFSDEDTDTIGTEAVDIIKRASQKASEAQVNPLRAEIERLKKERDEADRRAAQNSIEAEYAEFTNALGRKVSNWEAINSDPKFIDFLGGVDPDSGYTKGDLLRRAEQSRDVKRVADFMKEYIATQDPLAAEVGPTGNSSAAVARENKPVLIPASEIDKFYDDATRGVYKKQPQLYAEKNLKYEKAILEGRVDLKR